MKALKLTGTINEEEVSHSSTFFNYGTLDKNIVTKSVDRNEDNGRILSSIHKVIDASVVTISAKTLQKTNSCREHCNNWLDVGVGRKAIVFCFFVTT